MQDKPYLYIFLDESGNFDFSGKDSRYLILTSICVTRPFLFASYFDELKYNLIEYGKHIDSFHCANDSLPVRERVFSIIEQHLDSISLSALIVDKIAISNGLHSYPNFYPYMLGNLLSSILMQIDLKKYSEIIVITDSLPERGKRRAIEKAVKLTLKKMLPDSCKFRVMHHPSSSSYGLQIVDYCSWAIWRKWERQDVKYYSKIAKSIINEFELEKMTPSTTHMERAPWTLIIEEEPL